jgi:hypothetical protein
VASVGAKELELAKRFLKALQGPFAPEEFKDEYRGQDAAETSFHLTLSSLSRQRSAISFAVEVISSWISLPSGSQVAALKRKPPTGLLMCVVASL